MRIAFLCFLLLIMALRTVAQSPVLDTTLTATTRLPLTPLYYGLGTDRLGGARLETLDSGVVLPITGLDSSRRYWRVRLAATLSAYVPTDAVQTDTLPLRTGGLTGNARVWGEATADYVALSLPARLPYRSRQEVEPRRIVVDVFGVTANTNWLTQLRSARAVRQVYYEQLADGWLRLFIDLTTDRHWGYSLYYVRNVLTIRVRHAPARRRLRGLTIAVDAGHGGSNTGARGLNTGQLEKDLTLDVAQRLNRLLSRRGARVLLVRDRDTLLGPTARLLAMRTALPQLLVSIHFNASGNRAVRGVSTYYKHAGFAPLSRAILRELLRRGNVAEFGTVGSFNFFFNTPTDYPNVLVEGPFLSNAADEALISSPRYRQRMARAIRNGIRRYLRE